MYIPIFKEFTQEISTHLSAAETELQRLKAQAETSVSDEQEQKRIEAVQLLISARANYAEAACIYLRMANEMIGKLAEVEFSMALACPPKMQHLIEEAVNPDRPPH